MKPLWSESRGLMPWLIVIFMALLTITGIEENWVNTKFFTEKKDVIDGIAKILGVTGLLIGGILSYFRFFKGRTTSAKLNLSIRGGVIATDKPDMNLHWVDVEMENVGGIAIWGYNVDMYLTPLAQNSKKTLISQHKSAIQETSEGENLIDVGEIAVAHATTNIPTATVAVTYEVIVRDTSGSEWNRFLTISNSIPG